MKNPILLRATAGIFLIFLFTPATAQTSWQETPYQQWTIADVEIVLSKSPWALTRSREQIGSPPFPRGPAFDTGRVTVRLRSAMPIRLALVRLRQIKAKYDKMSTSEKAAFDTKMKALLECPGCLENYVVTLSPPWDDRSGVPIILREMSLKSVKRYVQLTNELGETRELVHFEPSKLDGGEAVFFFDRFNEKGVPLVDTSNKKIIVTFDYQLFHSAIAIPMRFEFDVSQIAVNGNVLF